MSFLFCFVLKGYVPRLSVIQFCAQHTISQKLITFNPSASEQHGRLGGCSGRESTHSQIKKKIKKIPSGGNCKDWPVARWWCIVPRFWGSAPGREAFVAKPWNYNFTCLQKTSPWVCEAKEEAGREWIPFFKVSFEITVWSISSTIAFYILFVSRRLKYPISTRAALN